MSDQWRARDSVLCGSLCFMFLVLLHQVRMPRARKQRSLVCAVLGSEDCTTNCGSAECSPTQIQTHSTLSELSSSIDETRDVATDLSIEHQRLAAELERMERAVAMSNGKPLPSLPAHPGKQPPRIMRTHHRLGRLSRDDESFAFFYRQARCRHVSVKSQRWTRV